MVEHSADGVDTTGARAGIHTVKLLTCFVARTVRVDHTFWATCNIRVPEMIWDALTRCSSVSILTDGVGSTGRRIAGLYHLYRNWH